MPGRSDRVVSAMPDPPANLSVQLVVGEFAGGVATHLGDNFGHEFHTFQPGRCNDLVDRVRIHLLILLSGWTTAEGPSPEVWRAVFRMTAPGGHRGPRPPGPRR